MIPFLIKSLDNTCMLIENCILPIQDDGISDVHEMIVQEQPFPEKRMRGVFEELGSSCSKFVSVVKGTQASGKTKLDKERQKLLIREMVRFRL